MNETQFGSIGEAADIRADTAPVPNLYKAIPNKCLEQGDLIQKDSDFVRGPLTTYHRYHVENKANEMFAVLTQSCDLARRGDAPCKARYISVAPVRSVRHALARNFDNFLVRTPGGLFSIGSTETEARYKDFLSKLINNNDTRYFYLPSRPELGLAEDSCIMLPLALPVKIEHYDLCTQGRIAQLDDLFQAKLGWSIGQQYSRVGTPDWPDDELDKKVTALSERTQVWFPPNDFDQLKNFIQDFETDKPGETLTLEDLELLRGKIKNRKELAIDIIFELLNDILPPPGKERFNIRKKLRQSSDFSKFFPNS
ncbi:hypothetical protein [Burkholderia ubonensis]|uniref:hypothetical protein n=1 Tax=Burkholderia ubonensis TaxID=101571 RepID=UPI000AF22D71|nr:hypothetical protein [Burkholderia ubonensis]